jgi:hypothetical protein
MTLQLPETTARPEVRDFVDRIRAFLADLDADEQQDLTAGLEADLTDLVDERGPEALGDPAAYARELRVAAGHPAEMRPQPGGRGLRVAAMDALDSAHASWDRLLDSLPGDPRGFISALQPVWWVVRGGVAWMVIQSVQGPTLMIDNVWLALLAVCVVVSVQAGRRSWGLDGVLASSVLARLLLLGLNVFAVCMTPGAVNDLSWHVAEQRAWQFGYSEPSGGDLPNPDVITYEGRQICELQVRDLQGNVIEQAQVWDVTSELPLPMRNDTSC